MNQPYSVQHQDGVSNILAKFHNILDRKAVLDLNRQRLQELHPEKDIIPRAAGLWNDQMVFIGNDIRKSLQLMHNLDFFRQKLQLSIIVNAGRAFVRKDSLIYQASDFLFVPRDGNMLDRGVKDLIIQKFSGNLPNSAK